MGNIDLLKGLEIGIEQNVGIMSMYPLIGDDLNIPLAEFKDITFKGNSDYGEMTFENNSNLPFVLPTSYFYTTKALAQDHSSYRYEILTPNKKTKINACCIQEHQCGYIDESDCGLKNFKILPLDIRKNILFDLKLSNIDFSSLWKYICLFQSQLVNEKAAHLIYFFTKFAKNLATFDAEFELVEKQRGCIITFNNQIVGIEIFPSHNYFKHIWKSLIRDSYGSSILKMSLLDLKTSFENCYNLNLENCLTIEEIEKSISEYDLNRRKNLKDNIENILNNLKIEDLTNQKNDLNYSLFIKNNIALESIRYNNSDFAFCSLILK